MNATIEKPKAKQKSDPPPVAWNCRLGHAWERTDDGVTVCFECDVRHDPKIHGPDPYGYLDMQK